MLRELLTHSSLCFEFVELTLVYFVCRIVRTVSYEYVSGLAEMLQQRIAFGLHPGVFQYVQAQAYRHSDGIESVAELPEKRH